MERAYRNAERYHEDHYNPAFYIEERERAILLFLFLFDTFGVLVVEFLEDQQKEQKKYNRSLPYLEQPIL